MVIITPSYFASLHHIKDWEDFERFGIASGVILIFALYFFLKFFDCVGWPNFLEVRTVPEEVSPAPLIVAVVAV